MLPQFVDRAVTVVGRRKGGQDGGMEILEGPDGNDIAIVRGGDEVWQSPFVEVVGTVNHDHSITESRSTNFGNEFGPYTTLWLCLCEFACKFGPQIRPCCCRSEDVQRGRHASKWPDEAPVRVIYIGPPHTHFYIGKKVSADTALLHLSQQNDALFPTARHAEMEISPLSCSSAT